MSVSRRQLIQWSGLTALAGLTASALPGCAGEPGPLDELDRIVTAYRELQIGVDRSSPARDRALAALDAVAGRYADGLAEPGNGDGTDARPLWPDLPKGPGSQYFPMMYYRLRTVTVAWATPGSAASKRPELPGRLLAGLDWLYRSQYNEGTTEQGNWYVYEIGVPYWLLQTIVALGDRLPAADRARYLRPVLRFVADPNRRTVKPETVETGANRADKALITVISGALAGDPARVAAGVAAVTDTAGKGADSLVTKVTKGDGFRTDGSFIQHESVPYPGHYGLVLLTAVAGLVHVTGGTRYQLEPEVRQRFRDSVDETFAPFLFAGSMHESVRGRMLSRQGETGADAGKQLIAAVALLARTAPEPARDRLAASVAGWLGGRGVLPEREPLELGRYAGGLQPVGVPEVEYVEALTEDESASPDSAERHLVFPQMDRMVHRAGGAWSASLGLSSTRTCRYEAINGQNKRGWYTGDGVLYVGLPEHPGHYADAYWPTVDASALPGTTGKDTPPPPLLGEPLPKGGTDYAGGVRFDDRHGCHGLDHVAQDGTLRAKKAWFFTPSAVLCLGCDITDGTGAPVRTVIENRNLGDKGTGALLVEGRAAPTELGQRAPLPGARWLHLEGVGGYVMLGAALDAPPEGILGVLREDRTGSWRDIDTGANTAGTLTPYSRRYQRIWLDHGVRPAGARYAYAVLPGATPEVTGASVGRWTVLVNTPLVQAVRVEQDLVGALFHAAAGVERVSVSGPAAVMWGPRQDGWVVTVADPTQRQDTLRLTVDRPGARVVRADPTVTVVATDPKLVVQVNVANSLGAPQTLVLS